MSWEIASKTLTALFLSLVPGVITMFVALIGAKYLHRSRAPDAAARRPKRVDSLVVGHHFVLMIGGLLLGVSPLVYGPLSKIVTEPPLSQGIYTVTVLLVLWLYLREIDQLADVPVSEGLSARVRKRINTVGVGLFSTFIFLTLLYHLIDGA